MNVHLLSVLLLRKIFHLVIFFATLPKTGSLLPNSAPRGTVATIALFKRCPLKIIMGVHDPDALAHVTTVIFLSTDLAVDNTCGI